MPNVDSDTISIEANAFAYCNAFKNISFNIVPVIFDMISFLGCDLSNLTSNTLIFEKDYKGSGIGYVQFSSVGALIGELRTATSGDQLRLVPARELQSSYPTIAVTYDGRDSRNSVDVAITPRSDVLGTISVELSGTLYIIDSAGSLDQIRVSKLVECPAGQSTATYLKGQDRYGTEDYSIRYATIKAKYLGANKATGARISCDAQHPDGDTNSILFDD